jgi:hypothetical protein
MKPRFITTLVVVALVAALTFFLTRIAFIDDVSSETFEAFIREHAADRLESQKTSSVSPLPLLLSIRFPMSDSKAQLGFPDRTDVYTLASTSGRFEFHAHVRRERVCLVTFEGNGTRSELRERMMAKFPKLSIR